MCFPSGYRLLAGPIRDRDTEIHLYPVRSPHQENPAAWKQGRSFDQPCAHNRDRRLPAER
jgi:hypothetical protein